MAPSFILSNRLVRAFSIDAIKVDVSRFTGFGMLAGAQGVGDTHDVAEQGRATALELLDAGQKTFAKKDCFKIFRLFKLY